MVLLWHCCKTNLYFWECCWAVCPRRWHCGKGRSSGALLKENKHSQRTLLFDLALFFSFSNVLLLSHWCFRMFCGGVASSCEVKGALWGGKKRPVWAQKSAVTTLSLFVCKTVLISARFPSHGFSWNVQTVIHYLWEADDKSVFNWKMQHTFTKYIHRSWRRERKDVKRRVREDGQWKERGISLTAEQ